MSRTTAESELVFRLRLGATMLPDMLAVEFVTSANVTLATPWVRATVDEAVIDWPLYDRLEHGWMSKRERAVWRLTRSLAVGDLADAYWALDPGRRRALIAALTFGENR